ncbi:MAG TPA: SPFH domain-containing protein [Trebonia sp.]|jgi:regulator of protease activity HflC (stomatin/prohibitin superfamily)|nr:SPFH domain-containing protein [Trebonia sp.]
MFWFILAIIVAVVGVLCFAGSAFASERGDKITTRVVGGVAIVVAFGLFMISGLKSVPVKNIGVPQSFGAVGKGVFEPGIHETWTPWLHLTDIDETVQTTTFEGGNCLTVRIGGQQTACADVTIQWQILPQAAGSLFSDYANSGNLMTSVTDAVVVRELKQVVNADLGDYNPITDVQSVVNTSSSTSQFSKFGPQILSQMRGDIGGRIKVLTVLMPYIHYDSQVESKLNAIQQSFANYAIAQENVKVNQQQAQAYQKLGTPGVNALISQCLDVVKSDAGSLPAGFSCFPGSSSGLAVSK